MSKNINRLISHIKDTNEVIMHVYKRFKQKLEMAIVLMFNVMYLYILNSMEYKKSFIYVLIAYLVNLVITILIFIIGNFIRNIKKN